MKLLKVAFVMAGVLVSAQAQKLNDFVGKYGNANGAGFMQPLADAFSANLNSGLFESAYVPLEGFHINFSVVALGAPVSDSRKTFLAKTDDPFSPPGSTQAPTIFGSTDGASVPGTGGTTYNFPGGLNLGLFAIAAPQITVGSVYGTEVLVRFFQAKLGDSFGTLKLYGIGFRHNVKRYFNLKNFPLDLAGGLYYQHFEIGDIVSANTVLISAQGSYKTSVLVLYGGPGVEISTMDVQYDGTSGKINLSLKAANSVRFTLGAALHLAFFRLFADYNLASQSTFTVGVGFAF
jgi:hypothetical protein